MKVNACNVVEINPIDVIQQLIHSEIGNSDICERDGNYHIVWMSNDGGYEHMEEIQTLKEVYDYVIALKGIKKYLENKNSKFRMGNKQKRVILDVNGHEVAIFNEKHIELAPSVCKFLNNSNNEK